MTLVLVTYTDEAVLMAADSRVGIQYTTGGPIDFGVDQKLFIFADTAIATFGTGAVQHVPTVINEGLRATTTFEDAIAFLLDKFRQDPGVRAFVGGIAAAGPAVKAVWPSKGEARSLYPDFGRPPPIWSGGVTERTFDVPADASLETTAQQMVGLFERETGDFVGPPFTFVERHLDRMRNRNWEMML